MAISKKDAKKAVAVLRTQMSAKKLETLLDSLHGATKNKSFRKSIVKLKKAVAKFERPSKSAEERKAA